MDLETHPTTLQEENRKKVYETLKDVHSRIEKLIQKTYQQKDSTATSQLRQLRTRITGLVAEAEKRGLDSFGSHKGSIDEFYEKENNFVDTSEKLLQEIENAIMTGENVDVFSISDLVDRMETVISHRIELTDKNLNEYENRITSKRQTEKEDRERKEKAAREEEQKAAEMEISDTVIPEEINVTSEVAGADMEKMQTGIVEDHEVSTADEAVPVKNEELDTETLSKLYSYINDLEQKFENEQPEISFNGEYVADKQWKTELSKRSARGTIKEGRFKQPSLIIDNYWKSIDGKREIIEMIQAKARTIGQGQYMSICFINSSWTQEIKEWASTYSHQKLGFFIYDVMEDELVYNENDENNRKYAYWHSRGGIQNRLTDVVDQLIEDEEYFDLKDLMKNSGLNLDGAKKFIGNLVKKKILVDVGLDSPKYTRAK
ncbi:hypothetical protein [Methanococcoides methylutens]|uniref:Uncharacterized protein n=1 Tax=Methanococcoides methylutens MM1 TaxID=1434104 RepID=A0A0E3SRL2_METMT|nr:hypothetical protein [Methanococcoides methylutens]AKB84842.1 hypothetical protein MCMEM_0789 [Methanococcoides methylutens MM1]